MCARDALRVAVDFDDITHLQASFDLPLTGNATYNLVSGLQGPAIDYEGRLRPIIIFSNELDLARLAPLNFCQPPLDPKFPGVLVPLGRGVSTRLIPPPRELPLTPRATNSSAAQEAHQ